MLDAVVHDVLVGLRNVIPVCVRLVVGFEPMLLAPFIVWARASGDLDHDNNANQPRNLIYWLPCLKNYCSV